MILIKKLFFIIAIVFTVSTLSYYSYDNYHSDTVHTKGYSTDKGFCIMFYQVSNRSYFWRNKNFIDIITDGCIRDYVHDSIPTDTIPFDSIHPSGIRVKLYKLSDITLFKCPKYKIPVIDSVGREKMLIRNIKINIYEN